MLQIPLRKLDELRPRPADLDRFETAPIEELRAWQRERLLWSLRHAYENVPHYRAKFNLAGLGPGDFKNIEDLAKFPFTTKSDPRRPARRANRRLSGTPNAILKSGATWWRARSAPAAVDPG